MSSSANSSPSSTSSTSSAMSPFNSISIQSFNFPVSVKLDIEEDNYMPWEQETMATMEAFDLLDHLDPTKAPPSQITKAGVTTDNPALKIWKRQDSFLRSWLLASLSSSLRIQMVGCNTTHQLWIKIVQIFAAFNVARVSKLKTQLRNIKKTNSMHKYLLDIKKITDQLQAVGEPVSTKNHIQAIFDGLSDDYNSSITSILSRKDDYTVAEIEAVFLNIEERIDKANKIEIPSQQTSIQANFNQTSQKPNQFFAGNRGRTFNGRGRGRYSRGRGRSYSGSSIQCQLCNKVGHSAWDCYYRFNPNHQLPHQQSLPPTPSQFTPQQHPQSYFASAMPMQLHQNSGLPHQFNQFYSPPQALLATPSSVTDPLWHPDTGASNHMTPSLSNFSTATTYTGYEGNSSPRIS